MRICVAAETAPREQRVALVPDSVGKLVKAGHEVVVQAGAGLAHRAVPGDGGATREARLEEQQQVQELLRRA